MLNKNLWKEVTIIFVGVSIIINGYFIGGAIKSIKTGDSNTTLVENTEGANTASVDGKVLNIPEVAIYLGISEEKLRG